MLLLSILALMATLNVVLSTECTRDCYKYCPSDYCFLMGNSTDNIPHYFNNSIFSAAQYCRSIGCYLPAFYNETEFTDFQSYHGCSNQTQSIAGLPVWLDYILSSYVSGVYNFTIQPSNPRSNVENYIPPWFPGSPTAKPEPNGGGSEHYLMWNGHTADTGNAPWWLKTLIPTVCMCQVCPGTMCSLAGGSITVSTGADYLFPYRPGSSVYFKCSYGYFRIGPTQTTCTVGTSLLDLYWSNPQPNCTVVYCENIFPPNPTSGYLNSTVFTAITGNYTFTCNPNYFHLQQNTTTPVYTCVQTNSTMQNGTWVPDSFTECISTCPNLTNPFNGTVNLDPFANPLGLPYAGINATYSCNIGYNLVGPHKRTCTPNGDWTLDTPICKPINCTNMFVGRTSGYMKNAEFTVVVQSYTFHCYPNYVDLAQYTATPQYNCTLYNASMTTGTWIPEFQECTITCPNLVSPSNGTVVYSPFTTNPLGLPPLGTNATYSCNVGFNLIGSSVATCLTVGNWSANPPICQANCSLTTWSSWSDCSTTCGDGIQIRTRNVTNPGSCFNLTDWQSCNVKKCGKSIEEVIGQVMQNIGCSALIGLVTSAFVINFVLRVRNLERLLHACQEITIVVAHIFILSFRNSVSDTLLCTATAFIIQYCFISCFTFFLLEAIQFYAYTTSVTVKGNFFPIWLNLLIGFGFPGLISVPLVITNYSQYPSTLSCWLNWGSTVVLGSVLPITILSGSTIILIESAGMGIFMPIINRNNIKYSTNWINRHSLVFVLPATLVHWFIGLTAIYYGNVALYTSVFVSFTVCGVLIFIHHSFCHYTVHVWLYKFYRKCCCKAGPMPEWITDPHNNKHIQGYEGLQSWFVLRKKKMFDAGFGDVRPYGTIIINNNLGSIYDNRSTLYNVGNLKRF